MNLVYKKKANKNKNTPYINVFILIISLGIVILILLLNFRLQSCDKQKDTKRTEQKNTIPNTPVVEETIDQCRNAIEEYFSEMHIIAKFDEIYAQIGTYPDENEDWATVNNSLPEWLYRFEATTKARYLGDILKTSIAVHDEASYRSDYAKYMQKRTKVLQLIAQFNIKQAQQITKIKGAAPVNMRLLEILSERTDVIKKIERYTLSLNFNNEL